MSAGKLILLNVLILVLGITAYLLYQKATPSPGPSTDAPAAAEVANGLSPDELASFDDGGGAEEASDLLGTKLILYMVGGIALGILLVWFVVPALAGAASNFAYSAPERAEPELGAAAVAKLAQGDFEGAIAEYKKLIELNPTDRFPVVEASKVYVERMGDAEGGIAFLEEALNNKEWPIDDAAFIMFRLVDIETTHRQDVSRAKELLTVITTEFENTRHAANAQHKLNEIARASQDAPGETDPQDFDRLPPRT